MGMISRVRGRIRSDSFSKIHTIKSEDKIANIVWLISIVFLLPYWAPRALLVALGGAWLMAAYTCLVVPLLISANYRYPARWYPAVAKLARKLGRRLQAPGARVLGVLKTAYAPIERAERLFLQMNNLSTMISQLLIFTACDRLLVFRGRLTCLYSLMFYNVVTYSVNYVREICTKEDWSPYVNLTRNSRVKHLAMSATKIVLEWTKAVTFIVTITFILLTLGLEQGLEYFRPTALYTLITGTYYLLSEKTFLELWPIALTALKLERLEGMEVLYSGFWARGVTTAIAVPLVPALMWSERWRLAALIAYICVILHGRYRFGEALNKLNEAQGSLARFRRATAEELSTLEDVCAVCLGTMKSARVTPCAHFFHADCLRKCLATSDRCPICVREYVFC
ncbi:E3 ubiquitin-protein ligase hrd-1-like [Bicyclus anynana]|uniref:E3 ubiquitin-protein ligase hrd-1-like n=1 Tax=Bicyclus anynana TaxID=110368 RepID=A0ABM3LYE4_BICAN|nr:E3 ubiquitin-protein ligase hrd-1-like [Bicyclus anynana]